MRVRLTSQARDDLLQIWYHINDSGSGPDIADQVLRRLDTRIRRLADFPYRGTARSDLHDDARMLVAERWVVLYRVLQSAVVISRIVDGARDLSRITFSLDDDLMLSNDLAAAKPTLRAAALARRRALSEEVRAEAALAVAGRSFPVALIPGTVVAGYMPIRGEIDPHPLMHSLAAQGATLAQPTIAADKQPLIFRAWRSGDPMQRGALGISEPLPDAAIVVPDIVLVPLAAFDRRGHRIGYGAGHYDRALAKLRLEKSIVAIGLAFATQEIAHVPDEAHDVPLDLVLTESEVIAIRSS